MKQIAIFCLVLLFSSCKAQGEKNESVKNDQTNIKKPVVTSEIKKDVQYEAEAAKKWLIESIEFYFDDEKDSDMSLITTKNYFEYKSDATGVFYDGGLSEEEFKAKWKDSFSTNFAGLGSGFLISAQDWSEIEVANCTLKSSTPDTYFFEVIIVETASKEKYRRDIKVIKFDNSFLIDDVLEYNE